MSPTHLTTAQTPRTSARSPWETVERRVLGQRLHALNCYGKAWAHTEEKGVRLLLGECLAAAASYLNPFVVDPVVGVHGLTQLILDYQVLFPDAQIRSAGRPLIHHHYAGWRWVLSSSAPIRICGANFGLVLAGQDIIQFDQDHRIASVMAFFDERRVARTSFTRRPPPPGKTRAGLAR